MGKVADRISARDAVVAARKYYGEVVEYRGPMTVEEIELSEDGRRWLITLGVVEEAPRRGALALALPPEKVYKRFEVKADTGEVVAMKIREV